jgi:aminotransferase
MSSTRQRCWWRFEVEMAGRRSVFNDIAAALGLVQLERLPDLLDRRREVQRHYRRALGDLDWLSLPPAPPTGVETTPAFFWVQCEHRDDLAVHLRRHDVYTTFRYEPLHRQPLYGSTADLPAADRAARTTLLLPQHPGLTESDLEHIVERVRDFAP